MVIKKNEMNTEIRNNMRGGNGEVEITHYVAKEKLKNARFLANIKLKPGASIGLHEHKDESEYFIIICGRGIVNDDGIEKQVEKGDIIITESGSSHGIKNNGNDILEIIGVIITY
jgi:mannose-6-phosphate isomerase-like protein (cupin superfamily)